MIVINKANRITYGIPHETHVAIEDAQMGTEIALRLMLLDCAAIC